jgi:hypothetical protein
MCYSDYGGTDGTISQHIIVSEHTGWELLGLQRRAIEW